jgi:predicted CoA-binding protein
MLLVRVVFCLVLTCSLLLSCVEMTSVLQRMLAEKVWCVVGSHGRNPICERLVSKLSSQDKIVHTINPRGGGLAALKDLSPLPEVINLVVNPQLGPSVVTEMNDHKISMLFVQPGAEFEGMEDLCREYGIDLYRGCVLIDS